MAPMFLQPGRHQVVEVLQACAAGTVRPPSPSRSLIYCNAAGRPSHLIYTPYLQNYEDPTKLARELGSS